MLVCVHDLIVCSALLLWAWCAFSDSLGLDCFSHSWCWAFSWLMEFCCREKWRVLMIRLGVWLCIVNDGIGHVIVLVLCCVQTRCSCWWVECYRSAGRWVDSIREFIFWLAITPRECQVAVWADSNWVVALDCELRLLVFLNWSFRFRRTIIICLLLTLDFRLAVLGNSKWLEVSRRFKFLASRDTIYTSTCRFQVLVLALN